MPNTTEGGHNVSHGGGAEGHLRTVDDDDGATPFLDMRRGGSLSGTGQAYSLLRS